MDASSVGSRKDLDACGALLQLCCRTVYAKLSSRTGCASLEDDVKKKTGENERNSSNERTKYTELKQNLTIISLCVTGGSPTKFSNLVYFYSYQYSISTSWPVTLHDMIEIIGLYGTSVFFKPGGHFCIFRVLFCHLSILSLAIVVVLGM
jgi:hypothetical protein